MSEVKYTEGLIVDLLCHHYFKTGADIIVPNCMITGREADLLVISNLHRAHEIEVKCTRSDLIQEFAPDRMKTPKKLSWSKSQKHHLLQGNGGIHMISRFSLAVPPHLVDLAKEITPEHFGIFMVTSEPKEGYTFNGSVTCVRRPKQIVNSRPLTDKELRLMCRITCSRYWNQRLYGAKGRK